MAQHANSRKTGGNRAAGRRRRSEGPVLPGWALMLVAMVAGTLAGLPLPAAAQSSSETPATGDTQATEAPPPHAVTGFRTARFGDDEAAVRAAIAVDFKLDDTAIERTENPVEATTALQVTVDDLLPGSGTASISYIFGYQSKVLVQVSVSWGPPIDIAADPARVVNTASRLRGYFLGLGFVAETVVTNQQLPNGSIMFFRGADADGRLVAMQLTPLRAPPPAEGEEPPPPRMGLVLSYVADPKNPDVFTIEKGAF